MLHRFLKFFVNTKKLWGSIVAMMLLSCQSAAIQASSGEAPAYANSPNTTSSVTSPNTVVQNGGSANTLLPSGTALVQREVAFLATYPALPDVGSVVSPNQPTDWYAKTVHYVQTVLGNMNASTNPFVVGAQNNGNMYYGVISYAINNPSNLSWTDSNRNGPEAIGTFPTIFDLLITGQSTNGIYQGIDWLNQSMTAFYSPISSYQTNGAYSNNWFMSSINSFSLWYLLWANITAADIIAVAGNAGTAFHGNIAQAANALMPMLTTPVTNTNQLPFAPLTQTSASENWAAWLQSPVYWATIGGYDFINYQLSTQTNGPVPNDAAQAPAGIAYVAYMAYLLTNHSGYAAQAKLAYDFYDSLPDPSLMSPHYEVIPSVAPFLAARMNAEQGTSYDVGKAINYQLVSYNNFAQDVRLYWSAMKGSVFAGAGLVGDTSSNGYVFAMNSMSAAGRMLAAAHYAPEFARAIAVYVSNVAQHARLFWPDEIPDENQPAAQIAWMAQWDPNRTVGYESGHVDTVVPSYCPNDNALVYCPTSDQADTNRYATPYGAAWVGYLSGIVAPHTGSSGCNLLCFVARTDTTDFLGEGLPRWLIYNPQSKADTYTLDLPDGIWLLWDNVNKQVISQQASSEVQLVLAADSVLVVTAAVANHGLKLTSSQLSTDLNRLLDASTGQVIDYGF